MDIESVKKLPVLDRFLYWIKERHSIYQKRLAGKPKPWTDDIVLQSYFFTNPHRENDKTTVWFREHVRDVLKDDPGVLMATIIFRWFVSIETGKVLLKHDLFEEWNEAKALKVLRAHRESAGKVFTGAYLIRSPQGMDKVAGVVQCISAVWKERERLLHRIEKAETLRMAHAHLKKFYGLGGFMAYEIVTDLRHTYLLRDAKDIDTWCHLGPGSMRGLIRMNGGIPPKNKKGRIKRHPPPVTNGLEQMQELLAMARKKLPKMKFEMRDIEHSLCEWDKMERVLWGQGRSKRLYKGSMT